jgi:hypothetical protein
MQMLILSIFISGLAAGHHTEITQELNFTSTTINAPPTTTSIQTATLTIISSTVTDYQRTVSADSDAKRVTMETESPNLERQDSATPTITILPDTTKIDSSVPTPTSKPTRISETNKITIIFALFGFAVIIIISGLLGHTNTRTMRFEYQILKDEDEPSMVQVGSLA